MPTVKEIIEGNVLAVIRAHDLDSKVLCREEKDLLWILSYMVEMILEDIAREATTGGRSHATSTTTNGPS